MLVDGRLQVGIRLEEVDPTQLRAPHLPGHLRQAAIVVKLRDLLLRAKGARNDHPLSVFTYELT